MKRIAKCLVVDSSGHYLVLELNNHPAFRNDADLPGGTMDSGETLLQTAIREAYEEVGLIITEDKMALLYEGSEYSKSGSYYALYRYDVTARPDITLSWEHTSYEWVTKEELIKRAASATDTYMHMVAATV